MLNPFLRETIENWVGDFCASDALRNLPPACSEYASSILNAFLASACEARGVAPDELDEADLKAALLGPVARLELPASARAAVCELCAAFLSELETQGRLGGGRTLGAFARALRPAFQEAAEGKVKPITRPGARIGRNDPCPCGSGRKYKKCCMRE